MLIPKKTKFRKCQRWDFSGKANKGNKVSFGEFGLIALEAKLITSRQIEAARRTITHALKRKGKVWITIFPDLPYTKKPAETRMGNGKGNVEYYVFVAKPGRVLFEISGVTEDMAKEVFTLAGHKLPVKTKMIKREQF